MTTLLPRKLTQKTSISQGKSPDGVQSAAPKDLLKLKEISEKLNLSTRRPSVIQWKKVENQIFLTSGITPKRAKRSGEVHRRSLAPGRHSSEETSQRWRVVGDTVSDLTEPGFET